jgi:hypothetical protein
MFLISLLFEFACLTKWGPHAGRITLCVCHWPGNEMNYDGLAYISFHISYLSTTISTCNLLILPVPVAARSEV